MGQNMKFFVLVALVAVAYGQRVAPGVPPQHYQNQPHHGQMPQHHQPPQQGQYQQQPPQHQPPQHQQMQQPQYQQQQQQHHQPPPGVPPPQQQQHHQQQQQQQQQHHVPPPQQNIPHQQHHQGGQPQVLNPNNIQHEREHIAEHAEVPIDTSKMSEAELQFHYFKMHDADSNNKLDGCELIKSLIHYHEQGSKEQHHHEAPKVEEKIFSDEELIALIDPILQMDDVNRDGFIDYPEFIRAQQKSQQNNN